MKLQAVKVLMICAILLVLYLFAGHDVVMFYAGEKTEIVEAGKQITSLCNAQGACPTTLEGWEQSIAGTSLAKGNMLYFVDADEESTGGAVRRRHQTFRLVYRFSLPDDWYEVRGGVGRTVTAGWAGR